MIPLVIRLPLDPDGTSPDNKIVGEPHTLSGRRIRAFATHSGAFFTESMSVIDATTGVPLRKDQYYAAEMYQFPSNRYGKEICAIVIVTDPTVSNSILANYQALGAEYSTSQQAIIQQIERLQLDTRPVAWKDIIGKPAGFIPSAHLHDAGDIYGFEYLVFAIDRIRDAIILGDVASHDAIYAYIDHLEAVLRALITQNGQALGNHLNDKMNPHGVTAGQINVFTKQETSNLLAQSISNLRAALNSRIDQEVAALVASINTLSTRLDQHIANRLNPHGVTAAQTGAMTILETNTAISVAVGNASTSLNNRITTEIAGVNASINSVSTDAANRFNGLYRGHLQQTTAGNAPNYTITADANLKVWVESSWTVKVGFHAGNGGTLSSLNIINTGLNGNIYQYDSAGVPQPAFIIPGMITELQWRGGSWLLLDPLPPVVKNVVDVFSWAARPVAKTTDVILVAELGMQSWKSVGGFTGYVTDDLGKVYYDAAQVTGRYGDVDLNGTWLPKAGYPALWAWANANGLVTSPQYWTSGVFYFSDINADTFAVPDLRNVFIRGTGTNSDDGSARNVGTFQPNALAGHTHSGSTDAAGDHFHGSGWGESQPNDNRYGIYSFSRGVGSGRTDYDNFDNKTSTNGNHAHNVSIGYTGGPETRPNNVALLPRMRCL